VNHYAYIEIKDPLSIEIKKTLFYFYYIQSKNTVTGVSLYIKYGNVEIEEIKNT
jgi:hypothetical protein